MKQLLQVITFGIVGVMNTLIDFSVYWTLTRVFDIYFVTANVISVIVATTAGFFMHKMITFRNAEKRIGGQFVKFASVSFGSLLINTGTIFVLVHYAAMNDLLAKVFATILVFIWSFILQKFWVFKIKPAVL